MKRGATSINILAEAAPDGTLPESPQPPAVGGCVTGISMGAGVLVGPTTVTKTTNGVCVGLGVPGVAVTTITKGVAVGSCVDVSVTVGTGV